MEGMFSGVVLAAVFGLAAGAAAVAAVLLYRVSRPQSPLREPRDG